MYSKLVKLLCLAPFVFASLHAFEDETVKILQVQCEDEPTEESTEVTEDAFFVR